MPSDRSPLVDTRTCALSAVLLPSTHVHDIRCFPLAGSDCTVTIGSTAKDADRAASQCDACGKADFDGRKVRAVRCGEVATFLFSDGLIIAAFHSGAHFLYRVRPLYVLGP